MSKSSAQADSAPVSDPEAFAFVQALAAELSTGKVELPSFPDIAMRVRQVLADETVTPEKVVRVVGSEPALAARLLQLANSAALEFQRQGRYRSAYGGQPHGLQHGAQRGHRVRHVAAQEGRCAEGAGEAAGCALAPQRRCGRDEPRGRASPRQDQS